MGVRRVGRVRDQWFDVWFFGLQLTLAHRPDEVRGADEQGTRHFGVVLDEAEAFSALVERLAAHDVAWIEEPAAHTAAELTGNVIEITYYAGSAAYLAEASGAS